MKYVLSLINIDNWSDECRSCRRQSLLHKGRPSTKTEKEPPDVILKVWNNLCGNIKTKVKMAKAEMRKEQEEGLLLDVLKKWWFKYLSRT